MLQFVCKKERVVRIEKRKAIKNISQLLKQHQPMVYDMGLLLMWASSLRLEKLNRGLVRRRRKASSVQITQLGIQMVKHAYNLQSNTYKYFFWGSYCTPFDLHSSATACKADKWCFCQLEPYLKSLCQELEVMFKHDTGRTIVVYMYSMHLCIVDDSSDYQGFITLPMMQYRVRPRELHVEGASFQG